eukprot:3418662-Amphidinium_carterae.1
MYGTQVTVWQKTWETTYTKTVSNLDLAEMTSSSHAQKRKLRRLARFWKRSSRSNLSRLLFGGLGPGTQQTCLLRHYQKPEPRMCSEVGQVWLSG